MFVFMVVVVGYIVMVEAEKTFDEEHREHAGEKRDGDPANCNCRRGIGGRNSRGGCRRVAKCYFGRGGGIEKGMREHVEDADAEHHAGDKADGKLHPAVR